jgi:hypothetical protein
VRPAGIGWTHRLAGGRQTREADVTQVELCEHHAKDRLRGAERTKDPSAREMLLRHALKWDGLVASKQSKLCAVCGRNKMLRGRLARRKQVAPGEAHDKIS